ncbi:MAG: ATP-dependent RecD-like DNA helicase [Clostridia bacterium]|nr:ATP-dependent RecD-like DNA helicase [Clostridia bacterium]
MEIKGQVESIVYYNEDNGYTVCNLDVNNELITAVGNMPFISVGDILQIEGDIINHAIYGEQIKVKSFEKIMPSTTVEVEKYLGSGIVKGVGPVTAKKIVAKYGEDTVNVIRFEPYKLAEISGITSEKAVKISEEFNKEWQLWQIVIFLQKYDIGATNANRVYKELGIYAIDKIKDNPYILLNTLYGVGFETVDKMAISLGFDYNSHFRVSSGIKYALGLSSRNGNTCSRQDELITYVANILKVPEELVVNEITELTYNKELFVENEYVFLNYFYEAEDAIARRVMMMCNDRVKKCINIESKLSDVENQLDIELSTEQKKAIKMVFNNKISIITGGPGTGKTTIIQCILKLLELEKLDFSLCAPTGRAAKRISETAGEEARTLHRLLNLGKMDEDYAINFEVPKLDQDVIIVDEMSMVDTVLMHFLLKALKDKTRLILIGDSDQLPSVGPGNVLKDLIDSDLVPVTKLTQIYRQAQESEIIVNAHKINSGEMIDLSKKDGDFFFINGTDILHQVSELVTERLKKYGNYDPYTDIQVLTPTKKGESGTRYLNKELQKALNPNMPNKNEKEFGGVTFREGDKVMQVKNNYDLTWESLDGKSYGSGIYNGDLGIIKTIHDDGFEVVFDEDKLVYYDIASVDELEHAYAITVHKSQGSEFPVVVMPLVFGPPMLYTRNLLYTAVTRAKELLVIVGDRGAVNRMIANNDIKRRNTGLKYKLDKYFHIFEKK